MTQDINPLRQLATVIAQECQTVDNAKRVKQSTILNALSKFAGQHSIQVGDTRLTTKKNAPNAPFQVVQARIALYESFVGGDLLPIDIETLCVTPVDTPFPDNIDGVFEYLWNTVSRAANAGVPLDVELDHPISLLNDLGIAIDNHDDSAINEAINACPRRLQRFLEREMVESLEGIDKNADPQHYYSSMQHYLVFRVRNELSDAREAFIKSHFLYTEA